METRAKQPQGCSTAPCTQPHIVLIAVFTLWFVPRTI